MVPVCKQLLKDNVATTEGLKADGQQLRHLCSLYLCPTLPSHPSY
jgi:hypothetical protein